MIDLNNKPSLGDVRGQSQGDVYPFIIVGIEGIDAGEVYGIPRSSVSYYVQSPAGKRVSRYFARSDDAEARALEIKRGLVEAPV